MTDKVIISKRLPIGIWTPMFECDDRAAAEHTLADLEKYSTGTFRIEGESNG